MSEFFLLKKPKIEIVISDEDSEEEDPEEDPEEEPEEENNGDGHLEEQIKNGPEEEPEEENNGDGHLEEQFKNDQEEALLALIEHRQKEVEHLHQRIAYYKSQLDEAEKRLEDTKTKLARLRGHNIKKAYKTAMNGSEVEKVERRSPSPLNSSGTSTQEQSKSTPLAHLPGHNIKKASKTSMNGCEEARVERRSPSAIKTSETLTQKQPKSTPLHQHDPKKSSGDSPLHRKVDSSQNQTQFRPHLLIPALNTTTSQLIKTKEPGSSLSSVQVQEQKKQKISSERGTKDIEPKGRGHNINFFSKTSMNGGEEAIVERRFPSPVKKSETSTQEQSKSTPLHQHDKTKSSGDNPLHKKDDSSQNQTQLKPHLMIPALNTTTSQLIKTKEPGSRLSGVQVNEEKMQKIPSKRETKDIEPKGMKRKLEPEQREHEDLIRMKGEKLHKISSKKETTDIEPKGAKRKLERREHEDLIPMIGKSSSPVTVSCQTCCLLASQHKRKLRTLVLCPTNDQLFATSALDGIINLWQIQGNGVSANLLSSTDCQSYKQRRWPEDVAWHPQGNKLFSIYTADGADSQISILNLNQGREKARVSFLPDKPHIKGIINSITFMPLNDDLFVTGGSDHAVVLWKEQDREDLWIPKPLHRFFHSSAVMGVSGMRHKNIVMSVGADKKIFGYDIQTERVDYKHNIDSKCMSVVPNPCDFNLFMVQTGAPERQLRLFDLRLRQVETHSFGWRQESSESQSALINQAWSPDGLYITSGSVDPTIHIFDIRYNSQKPSQTIRAHQKRVFKAAWHDGLPLLISISSDLNIGLHRIV